MPFPAVKLGVVAVRQLAKPLVKTIEKRAEQSKFFRRICVQFAYHYHLVEQKVIRSFYDRDSSNAYIPELNEKRSVELGASVVGEILIFSVAAGALLYEYRRSVLKEAKKEEMLEEKLRNLQSAIAELQAENDRILKSVFPNQTHHREALISTMPMFVPGMLSQLYDIVIGGWFGGGPSADEGNLVYTSTAASSAPSAPLIVEEGKGNKEKTSTANHDVSPAGIVRPSQDAKSEESNEIKLSNGTTVFIAAPKK